MLLNGITHIVQTDNSTVSFIKNLRQMSGKLMRWSLIIEEYQLEFQHVPGKSNCSPDYISRNLVQTEDVPVDEVTLETVVAHIGPPQKAYHSANNSPTSSRQRKIFPRKIRVHKYQKSRCGKHSKRPLESITEENETGETTMMTQSVNR